MHDSVKKIIKRESCQILYFDHTIKWYTQKPENEIPEIIWGLQIQTNQIIPTRSLDQMLINKKKELAFLRIFAFPVDNVVKIKENIKIDNYLNLASDLKKLWNV